MVMGSFLERVRSSLSEHTLYHVLCAIALSPRSTVSLEDMITKHHIHGLDFFALLSDPRIREDGLGQIGIAPPVETPYRLYFTMTKRSWRGHQGVKSTKMYTFYETPREALEACTLKSKAVVLAWDVGSSLEANAGLSLFQISNTTWHAPGKDLDMTHVCLSSERKYHACL
jgi:hypothetical protein